MNILMSKQNIYSTVVHFGNLFCQPMTRNLNYNPKYEKKDSVYKLNGIVYLMILWKLKIKIY